MNDFYNGQKVVCIDDSVKPEFLLIASELLPNWIKRGRSYIVRQYLENDGIVPGLLLEGVNNPPVYIKLLGRVQEPAFATWRFAPTVEKKEYIESEIYSEDSVLA